MTSVLHLLISAEAAAYAEYQFRTCSENQFNKNVILLMQKMFLSLTKISWSNFKKERERERETQRTSFYVCSLGHFTGGGKGALETVNFPTKCNFQQLCYLVPTRCGGSWYKLPAPGNPEGVPGPDYVTCLFVSLGSIIIYSL